MRESIYGLMLHVTIHFLCVMRQFLFDVCCIFVISVFSLKIFYFMKVHNNIYKLHNEKGSERKLIAYRALLLKINEMYTIRQK